LRVLRVPLSIATVASGLRRSDMSRRRCARQTMGGQWRAGNAGD
jgi:hypothetical protein